MESPYRSTIKTRPIYENQGIDRVERNEIVRQKVFYDVVPIQKISILNHLLPKLRFNKHYKIMPAATVSLVLSSIKIILPVVLFSR